MTDTSTEKEEFSLYTNPRSDEIVAAIADGFLNVLKESELKDKTLKLDEFSNILINVCFSLLGSSLGKGLTFQVVEEVTEAFMKETIKIAGAMHARAAAREGHSVDEQIASMFKTLEQGYIKL